MQISSENKGYTSRLQEQSWHVTPSTGPCAPWIWSMLLVAATVLVAILGGVPQPQALS